MRLRDLTVLKAISSGIVCFCVPVSPASAETTKTLGVKVTHYAVSTTALPAGDAEGHFIGIGQREGEAVFSNGETAKYSNAFTFDGRIGQGLPSKGYTKFVFNDGSWITLTWSAESITEQDGLSSTKGKGTVTNGAGRFKGIKGEAVFSGKELKPTAQDPKRTAVMNATLTYTLP